MDQLDIRELPTRDGYDLWSSIYDSDGNPLILLETPEVEGAFGPVTGRSILDLGCGTGRHALRLAALGARVTACDFSPGMLAQARAKPGAEQVDWVVQDLATRLPFEDGQFHGVLSALVLDHVRDVDAYFKEAARVCRRGGRIVFTVMHPALMLRGVQARFTDPATGSRVHPESVPNQISDYVMAAMRAGLRFARFSEHALTEEHAKLNERAAKHIGWPMLLVMVLERA
jgi:ubiquinone/menaquinone biosynthesis C-methylase UbiE